MIIFAIPLRAKATTKNWDFCVERFNATIQSIFNQTNPNFKCLVACNDIPKLEKEYDNRLEFIQVNTAIPMEWIEMARDKFWKLTAIAVRVHEILEQQSNPENGIYVMPVDADDLLNCHISQWRAEHPDEHGAVSKNGYVWRQGEKVFRKYHDMHTYCGSCNVIKMYLDDLPKDMPYPDERALEQSVAKELNARYPIRYDHNIVVEQYEKSGKPFAKLPFKSTVYVLGTGENISSIAHATDNHSEEKRFHPIAFLRNINIFSMRYISRRVKKEFGIQ